MCRVPKSLWRSKFTAGISEAVKKLKKGDLIESDCFFCLMNHGGDDHLKLPVGKKGFIFLFASDYCATVSHFSFFSWKTRKANFPPLPTVQLRFPT